jgi:hypothetical protein
VRSPLHSGEGQNAAIGQCPLTGPRGRPVPGLWTVRSELWPLWTQPPELLNIEDIKVVSHCQHEGIGITLQVEPTKKESVCPVERKVRDYIKIIDI